MPDGVLTDEMIATSLRGRSLVVEHPVRDAKIVLLQKLQMKLFIWPLKIKFHSYLGFMILF